MKTFGERLRHAREARGLSQEDFAESLGLERASASSIVRWESGTEPKANRIEQIVRALDIDGHWLLTGEGPMRPDPQMDAIKLEVIGVVADETIDLETAEKIRQSVQAIVRGRDEDADEMRADTEGASPFGDGRGDRRKVEPK